jgi:hypothetical protein
MEDRSAFRRLVRQGDSSAREVSRANAGPGPEKEEE